MKTNQIVKIALFAFILSSCGSTKNLTPEFQGFGKEVVMPCVEESYDNADYYKGLGTGTDVNIGNARSAALKSAKSEVNAKLGGLVKGLSSDYSKTIAGSTERTERIMEGEFFTVVDKLLNDAEKICEGTTKDNRGAYNAFIVIQISKKEILTKMENSLSTNEELKIEFDREQFRKFAEKKMKDLENAKDNR